MYICMCSISNVGSEFFGVDYNQDFVLHEPIGDAIHVVGTEADWRCHPEGLQKSFRPAWILPLSF